MLILGDVFAVIASLVGVFLTSYAMILGLSLLFGGRARAAADDLQASPKRAVMKGLFVGLPVLLFALVLSGIPNPLTKLIGFMLLVGFLMLSIFGSSGVAWFMADRMRSLDPNLTQPVAMSRSIMLLVGAGLLPLVGWFLFAPVLLVVSFGAGLGAWMRVPERAVN